MDSTKKYILSLAWNSSLYLPNYVLLIHSLISSLTDQLVLWFHRFDRSRERSSRTPRIGARGVHDPIWSTVPMNCAKVTRSRLTPSGCGKPCR